MNENQNNDTNLELARHIDLVNTGLPSNYRDSLNDTLDSYKESIDIEVSGKNEVWDHVDKQLAKKVERGLIYNLDPRLLAIAATFVIAATGIWFWLGQQSTSPIDYVALVGQGNTKVTLNDGTEIILRQNSKMTKLDETTFLLDGEAFFDVEHNPNRVFRVEANDASIEVLGTQFNVDTRKGGLRAYLRQGRIRLQSSTNAIELEPGDAAMAENGVASFLSNSTEDEFIDWQLGFLELNQTVVQDAALELAQHFDINIELPAAISSQTISGSLSLENLETSLNDLGLVLDGAFEIVNESTYTFVAN